MTVQRTEGSHSPTATSPPRETIYDALLRRGITRRSFMKFCSAMAAVLALPTATAAGRRALETKPKPILVWLEFQDCAATRSRSCARRRPTSPRSSSTCSRSTTTRRSWPPPATGRGGPREDGRRSSKGSYLAVVEGSIPTGDDGAYCTIGGRTALDIAREVCGNAAATIAVGTCASFGGCRRRAEPDRRARRPGAVPGVEPHQSRRPARPTSRTSPR